MRTCRTLLVTGGTAPHDYPGSVRAITEAIEGGGASVMSVPDPSALRDVSGEAFDAVVLFIDGPRLDDAGIDALGRFVRAGGGLVAIHSTCGANESSDSFGRLVGTRIKKGVFCEYVVSVSDPSHPLARDVTEFRLDDELYVLDPKSDVHPFLTAPLDDSPQWFAYTRDEGKGRVVYLAAGHKVESFRDPAYKQLLARSVRFAAGEA